MKDTENEKTSSGTNVLERLGAARAYVYREAKSSFEKNSKNCKYRSRGPDGKARCSHPLGEQLCRFETCPKIREEGEV